MFDRYETMYDAHIGYIAVTGHRIYLFNEVARGVSATLAVQRTVLKEEEETQQ